MNSAPTESIPQGEAIENAGKRAVKLAEYVPPGSEAQKRSAVQHGRVGDRGRLVRWNTESGLSVINSCGRDLTSGAAHVLS